MTGLRAITAPSYKQPNKLSQLQKTQLNLKIKFALISRLWKCKEGERLMITANSFMKTDQLDGFCPLWRSEWENSGLSRNQSDCRICSVPLAHVLKKDNFTSIHQRFLAFYEHDSVTRYYIYSSSICSDYYPGFQRIFFSYRYCWFAAKPG